MENLSNDQEQLNNEPEELPVDLPNDPVAGEGGDNLDSGEPQPDSEPEEFEIDLGSEEQDSQEKAGVPVYKLKKLRAQKRELKTENAEVKNANDALKKELQELRAEVSKVGAGPKPKYEDFYDDVEYQNAYGEWYAKTNGNQVAKAPAATTPATTPAPLFSDEDFDSHYERASELSTKYNIADYEQAESSLRERMANELGVDVGGTIVDALIKEAGEKSHLVTYAVGKSEARQGQLLKSLRNDSENGTRTTEKLIWKWTEEAGIKPRNKHVKTEPEAIPSATGDSNSLEKQIKQQLDRWKESGTIADHKKLTALRKQRG